MYFVQMFKVNWKMEVPLQFVKYFVNNGKLLHKVVREDDKTFHALVVPTLLAKYVLHEAHVALGTIVQLATIDM